MNFHENDHVNVSGRKTPALFSLVDAYRLQKCKAANKLQRKKCASLIYAIMHLDCK